MDTEDLVQEVYLRWDKTDAQEIESPGTFLRTVITRLAIDHLRKVKNHVSCMMGFGYRSH